MLQISDYELELMKTIWSKGGAALYADIVRGLGEKGTPLTKNTIITLLSRLMEKGFLRTSKIGRKNKYIALISEEEYQAAQTKTFLEKVFEGSARVLVSTLIRKDLLTPEDYEELRKDWEGGEEGVE